MPTNAYLNGSNSCSEKLSKLLRFAQIVSALDANSLSSALLNLEAILVVDATNVVGKKFFKTRKLQHHFSIPKRSLKQISNTILPYSPSLNDKTHSLDSSTHLT